MPLCTTHLIQVERRQCQRLRSICLVLCSRAGAPINSKLAAFVRLRISWIPDFICFPANPAVLNIAVMRLWQRFSSGSVNHSII